MNCPNCGHDMRQMGCKVTGLPLHWCPLCGTIHGCGLDDGPVTPALVDRCWKFKFDAVTSRPSCLVTDHLAMLLETHGVNEAIGPPTTEAPQ